MMELTKIMSTVLYCVLGKLSSSFMYHNSAVLAQTEKQQRSMGKITNKSTTAINRQKQKRKISDITARLSAI